MARRLFDRDPERGLTIWYEDTDDGGFALTYEQDCEPFLEANKEKQSAGREYYARDPDMWRVASIPIIVQYKWLMEKGVNVHDPGHWPAVKRLLNDPEYRYLKTAEIII